METLVFDDDITVMYVAATIFPAGVMDAFKTLHNLVPMGGSRKFFGLSRPEDGGGIQYKAAAEVQQPGEAEKLGLETLLLSKGEYISVTITDFMKDIQAIGATFQQLIQRPGIDQQGYCVEWYFNDKDVRCMVRLDK